MPNHTKHVCFIILFYSLQFISYIFRPFIFLYIFLNKDVLFSGSEMQIIFNTIEYEINTFNSFFIVTPCILIYAKFTHQQMHFY